MPSKRIDFEALKAADTEACNPIEGVFIEDEEDPFAAGKTMLMIAPTFLGF